jgi:predicted MFS family arabinose efflux permease
MSATKGIGNAKLSTGTRAFRAASVVTPYRQALHSRPFRRLLAGYGVSALGDGAGYVAVAWLAASIVPVAQRPYVVGLALAAYILPGALVGLGAGRRTHRMDPRGLIALDAGTRMLALGAVSVLAWTGRLGLAAYILLLAGSSVFRTLGLGGFVGLVPTYVAREHRFAANSAVEAMSTLSLTVIGPGLGGLGVAAFGAPAVIAIDVATFVVLLAAVATVPGRVVSDVAGSEPASAARHGLRILLSRPALAWLLALTLVFYGLYGPVETALPILVQRDLHGGPGLLGLIWAAFGAGALVGGLVAGTRRITNLRRFALTIVGAWGVALLVVAMTAQPVVVLLGIAMGGLVYAPYPAAATTFLQQELSDGELTAGAVAWHGVSSGVVPLGTALGGPLIALLGPRSTLAASAIATVLLAAVFTVFIRQRP